MSFTLSSHALEPNGTAVYNELGSQLYLGTLFLDTPNQTANEILSSSQAKRMELRFTEAMSKRRWAQNWTQSMAINAPRDDMVAAADDLSEALGAFQSGLKQGDQVSIDYDPLYGTSISVNGVTLIKEKSATLFSLFLSGWIGPVPPNSQFKSAILGQENSQNDYTNFLSIKPTADRISAIKSWNTDLKLKEAEEAAALAAAEAEEAAKLAEEEAMKIAEEEAEKKATEEKLAEEKRLELIEEEKRKAQEAARQTAEAEAKKEAERLAALAAQDAQQASSDKAAEDDVDVSVDAILAQQDYTTQIIRKIYSSVKYPKAAVRKSQEGSVRATVTIDKAGKLVNVVVVEASEFASLNDAAVEAITDAAPFPAIPAGVKLESIELMVPIAFKLN